MVYIEGEGYRPISDTGETWSHRGETVLFFLALAVVGCTDGGLEDRSLTVAAESEGGAPPIFDGTEKAPWGSPIGGTVGTDACPWRRPVALFEASAGQAPNLWRPITSRAHQVGDPRSLVIENQDVRLAYELTAEHQQAANSLFFRRDDGTWHRVTDRYYGDFTYWQSSSITPATEVKITHLTGQWVELEYTFADHVVRPGGSRSIDDISMPFTKTVMMHKCLPGYFIRLDSERWDVPGERELGLGHSSQLAFSRTNVSMHPAEWGSRLLIDADQPRPAWAAALPSNLEDDVIGVFVPHQRKTVWSYQSVPAPGGLVVMNNIERWRPGESSFRYQAFIGAYESKTLQYPLLVSDFEPSQGWAVMEDQFAMGGTYARLQPQETLRVPVSFESRSGYEIWLRYRVGRESRLEVKLGEQTGSVSLPGTVGVWEETFNRSEEHFFDYEKIITMTPRSAFDEMSLELTLSGQESIDIDAVALVPAERCQRVADSAYEFIRNGASEGD